MAWFRTVVAIGALTGIAGGVGCAHTAVGGAHTGADGAHTDAGGADTDVRCFREGVPPPARITPDAPLLVGISPSQKSARECPRERPADGAPCKLPLLPATSSAGDPVEVWASCWYARAGAPCDPAECTCQRSSPDAPPTYRCTVPAIE